MDDERADGRTFWKWWRASRFVYIYISPSSCASNIKDVEQNTEQKGADAWRPVMRRQCNQEMGSVVFSLSPSSALRHSLVSFLFLFYVHKTQLSRSDYIHIYVQVLDKSDIITHRRRRKKKGGKFESPGCGKMNTWSINKFFFLCSLCPSFLIYTFTSYDNQSAWGRLYRPAIRSPPPVIDVVLVDDARKPFNLNRDIEWPPVFFFFFWF